MGKSKGNAATRLAFILVAITVGVLEWLALSRSRLHDRFFAGRAWL